MTDLMLISSYQRSNSLRTKCCTVDLYTGDLVCDVGDIIVTEIRSSYVAIVFLGGVDP